RVLFRSQHRPRARPGRAEDEPRREARHRPAHHRRLLLRLRRRRALHPRGAQGAREGDEPDRQVGSALRAPRDQRRRRPCRGVLRAVQPRPARPEAERRQPPGGLSRGMSDDAARAVASFQPHKLELIGLKSNADDAADGASVEVGAGGLTMYDNVDRKGRTVSTDLCRGPHLPSTKLIGNGFPLTRSAAAYWRGSEENPMLQRIYGTAWPTKEELRAHQERIAEAERRDHRRLGSELDLFSFPDEIGSGLPVF